MRHLPVVRMPVARVAAVTAALGLGLLTAGCLPDQLDGRQEAAAVSPAIDLTWFEGASATEVVDAGLVALAQVGSVRLHQDAEVPVGADPVVSKDLLVATGDGIGDAVDGDCAGTLQLPGWSEPAELLVQDDLGVFRGTADFWAGFADLAPEVRDVLAEQYADTWTTVPGLATLCALDDFLSPVGALLGDDAATKAGLGDVGGVPAGRVVSAGDERTVTVWVRLAEPHLVLQVAIDRTAGDDGSTYRTVTTFTGVDEALAIDFPPPDDVRAFELPPEPAVGAPTG